MAKLTPKASLNEWQQLLAKSSYVKKTWTTAEVDKKPLAQFAREVSPMYAHILGNPTIVAKENTKGKIFLKMVIPLEGGESEFDLSYTVKEGDFQEGDTIDKDSLVFCVERFHHLSHLYVTGELL